MSKLQNFLLDLSRAHFQASAYTQQWATSLFHLCFSFELFKSMYSLALKMSFTLADAAFAPHSICHWVIYSITIKYLELIN